MATPFWQSFANAKITENDVKNILNINPSRQPSQCRCCRPKFLGDQFFAAGSVMSKSTVQVTYRVTQRAAMPLPCHKNCLRRAEKPLGESCKLPYQLIDIQPRSG
jgi:hypothetical protein